MKFRDSLRIGVVKMPNDKNFAKYVLTLLTNFQKENKTIETDKTRLYSSRYLLSE